MSKVVILKKRERAPKLRDAAVGLLRAFGRWEEQFGSHVLMCDVGRFHISLLTQFGDKAGNLQLLASYNYFRKLNGRPLVTQPTAQLDIWENGSKVANFAWRDDEPITMTGFRPGQWEAELLGHYQQHVPQAADQPMALVLVGADPVRGRPHHSD